MGAINVSDLSYAHPGGDVLFSEVSFAVPAGGGSLTTLSYEWDAAGRRTAIVFVVFWPGRRRPT